MINTPEAIKKIFAGNERSKMNKKTSDADLHPEESTAIMEDQQKLNESADVVATRVADRRMRIENAAVERPAKKPKVDKREPSAANKDSHAPSLSSTEGSDVCATNTAMEEQQEANENGQTGNDQTGDQNADRKDTGKDDLQSTIEDGPTRNAQDKSEENVPASNEDDVNEQVFEIVSITATSGLDQPNEYGLAASDIENKKAQSILDSTYDSDGDADVIDSSTKKFDSPQTEQNDGVVKPEHVNSVRQEMNEGENDQVDEGDQNGTEDDVPSDPSDASDSDVEPVHDLSSDSHSSNESLLELDDYNQNVSVDEES